MPRRWERGRGDNRYPSRSVRCTSVVPWIFTSYRGTAIPIQIGILSDTHDNVEATERATDRLGPPVIHYFEEFELHGVLDNKAEIR